MLLQGHILDSKEKLLIQHYLSSAHIGEVNMVQSIKAILI